MEVAEPSSVMKSENEPSPPPNPLDDSEDEDNPLLNDNRALLLSDIADDQFGLTTADILGTCVSCLRVCWTESESVVSQCRQLYYTRTGSCALWNTTAHETHTPTFFTLTRALPDSHVHTHTHTHIQVLLHKAEHNDLETWSHWKGIRGHSRSPLNNMSGSIINFVWGMCAMLTSVLLHSNKHLTTEVKQRIQTTTSQTIN